MNPSDTSALFEAIEDGNIAIIQEMINKDTSLLKVENEYGSTPLMWAAASMERTPEMIKFLIDAGADVNTKTKEGYTALHMLIDVNGTTGTGMVPGQIAKHLVDAGADVEIRQHWGWTPLMKAAVEGTPDELQALVAVGGDVNKLFPNDTLPEFLSGRTTLMATMGEPEKTQIMIDAGVDLLAIDAHGNTVLEYARQCIIEAGAGGTDIKEITDELTDSSLAEVLTQMKDAGIDPDSSLDATGQTLRQSIESSLKENFEKTKEYDYAGEVGKSLQLIETALKNAR